MKKISLLIGILVLVFNTMFAQKFEWGGRSNNNSSSYLGFDGNGNIYTYGSFFRDMVIDTGDGEIEISAPQAPTDNGYIMKKDKNGKFLWVKQFNSNSPLKVFGRAPFHVSKSGNLYCEGQFFGTADFDPGPDEYELTSRENANRFVVKLDSNGNFKWAHTWAGRLDITIFKLDKNENLFIAGYFYDRVDFDPGPGTHFIDSREGQSERGVAYLMKLNSDGELVWVKTFGGDLEFRGAYVITDINFDSKENILLVGGFDDNVDFDPGPDTFIVRSRNFTDKMIQKLDSLGNFIWAKPLFHDHNVVNFFALPYQLSVDASDNLIITGIYRDSFDVDPGPDVHYIKREIVDEFTPFAPYVLKLDSDGNFKWVNAMVATGGLGIRTITDGMNNVYGFGQFQGRLDADPGPDSLIFEVEYEAGVWNRARNLLFYKWDSLGNLVWAAQLGDETTRLGVEYFHVDSCGENIFLVGEIEFSILDLDPSADSFKVNSEDGKTHFLSKYSDIQLKKFFRDADGDGYGDLLSSIIESKRPQGYSADSSDCDDNNALVFPGAKEICDNLDNNCDGIVDEGLEISYTASHENPTCFNSCDASAQISLDSSYAVSWSNGEQGHQLTGLCLDSTSTVLYYDILDSVACPVSDSIKFQIPERLRINVLSEDSIFILGGMEPYDTTTYVVGDYFYADVIDANGCTSTDSVLSKPSSIADANGDFQVNVFPNPSTGSLFINIENENQDFTAEMIDLSGRKVLNVQNETQLNLNKLPKGMYYLNIRLEDGKQTMRKIVLK